MPTAPEPFATLRGRGVYLPQAEAVVVADLHLGRASASAVDAPLGEGPSVIAGLESLLQRFAPTELVLAGDVLDAFSRVPREARATLANVRSAAADHAAAITVLAGNHDAQLESLLGEPPADAHELDDGTVVCHGHEPPAIEGRRYVVGHDHPAIDIEGRRRPCVVFGAGVYRGADVIGLPAFNPWVPGTAVNGWADGDPLSPLLAEAASLRPLVWDADAGSTLSFPPLGSLGPYL